MALQVVQIVFAVAIVAAFAAVQLGVAHPDELGYLSTNLVSSAALAVTAVLTAQVGFVITNTLWVAVSTAGLIRLARDSGPR